MTLPDVHGPLLYAAIVAAAAVEGEVTFVAASALVGRGLLDPTGVLLAGAAGAAIGDQAWFYLIRGALQRWRDRIPAVARRREWLVGRVRRHEIATVCAIRFAPGLRIALAATCAYVNVRPLRFSFWNAVSSLCWAALLLGAIAWAGPGVLDRVGISGWWGALIPAGAILLVSVVLGRTERRRLETHDDGPRP